VLSRRKTDRCEKSKKQTTGKLTSFRIRFEKYTRIKKERRVDNEMRSNKREIKN
jgi:hypothetical protein